MCPRAGRRTSLFYFLTCEGEVITVPVHRIATRCKYVTLLVRRTQTLSGRSTRCCMDTSCCSFAVLGLCFYPAPSFLIPLRFHLGSGGAAPRKIQLWTNPPSASAVCTPASESEENQGPGGWSHSGSRWPASSTGPRPPSTPFQGIGPATLHTNISFIFLNAKASPPFSSATYCLALCFTERLLLSRVRLSPISG